MYVAACFRLHGYASWKQFYVDAFAVIALGLGFAVNAPALALLMWRPGLAAVGGVLVITLLRHYLLAHLLAEFDNEETTLTLPAVQWSLVVKSASYFMVRPPPRLPFFFPSSPPLPSSPSTLPSSHPSWLFYGANLPPSFFAISTPAECEPFPPVPFSQLMTLVSVWAVALGQLGAAAAALVLLSLSIIGINVLVFDPVYAAALLLSGVLMHTSILAAELGAAPLDGSARPRWLEVVVVIPALVVLLQVQAFATRWSHAQATRRDFVLQLLARHRRNMSRYLVRLAGHLFPFKMLELKISEVEGTCECGERFRRF